MKKTLTIEGDIKAVIHMPSPNFDPLTASVAEQVANGFPPMPDDPRHRERYARMWHRLKNKIRFVEPTFRLERDRTHGARRREATAGTQTSTNWSGGVVNPPAGQTFSWIEGDWVIPAVDAPTQNQWYYCATWIGIDGDGSGDVFQAGIESDVFASGSGLVTNYYPWWEFYPGGSVAITNFPVSPGDYITAILCSGSGAGSTTGTVWFTNVTTGVSTPGITLTAPSGTKLIGNCAEWIVEAPQVNGSQSALADYGEVFFSVCEAFTNKGTTVDGGTGSNINMTAGGKTVSDGVLITPTIIQCLYAGPQP